MHPKGAFNKLQKKAQAKQSNSQVMSRKHYQNINSVCRLKWMELPGKLRDFLSWYAASARTNFNLCQGADVDTILFPLVENAAKLLLGRDAVNTMIPKWTRDAKTLNIEPLLHFSSFFPIFSASDPMATSGRGPLGVEAWANQVSNSSASLMSPSLECLVCGGGKW